MKTRNIINIILAFVVVINIALMAALKPFTALFFAMSFFWKVFYIVVACGWPALILVPIAIVLVPVAAIPNKGKPFRDRYMNLTSYTFLVVSLLVFMLNSTMVIVSYASGKEIFKRELYTDIKGTDEDITGLRNGHFRTEFSLIRREGNRQFETSLRRGLLTEYSVTWLSNNEYKLVRLKGEDFGVNDTVVVKITSNLPDRYDCCLKCGDYAQPAVVYKE